MIHKVVRNAEVNPCTDGTATCNPNSICVPDQPNDSYTVRDLIELSMCWNNIFKV